MAHFLEIRLHGHAKRRLRELSEERPKYHPHITLARPFTPHDEARVVEQVAEHCSGYGPIPFTIGDEARFPQGVRYLTVRSDELQSFDSGLERALEPHVTFYRRLGPHKILHSTIHPFGPRPHTENIPQYLLRITAIKDHRIWFEYDLLSHDVLSREEALDDDRWDQTVAQFTKQTGLVPTLNGFQALR